MFKNIFVAPQPHLSPSPSTSCFTSVTALVSQFLKAAWCFHLRSTSHPHCARGPSGSVIQNRNHTTQHRIIFTGLIYYSNRTEQNQNRKKVHGAQSRKNQAQASKIPLLVESHRTHLITVATGCDNPCKMSTRAFTRLKAKEDLMRDLPDQYPPASTYQNFRLPEGNQVFNINYIACTKDFRHSKPVFSRNGGNPPEI